MFSKLGLFFRVILTMLRLQKCYSNDINDKMCYVQGTYQRHLIEA